MSIFPLIGSLGVYLYKQKFFGQPLTSRSSEWVNADYMKLKLTNNSN